MSNQYYLPEDLVVADINDHKLWKSVYEQLLQNYGQERVILDHARAAFENTCAKCVGALSFEEFMRKVRLTWLWERPPLPRGIVEGER